MEKFLLGERLNEQEKTAEYLVRIFNLLKTRGDIAITDKDSHFNKTEIQLIGEIILANREKRKTFSSELAKKLCLTRSAVSHVVKRLERRGAVKCFTSDKDKKVEYVELTPKFIGRYKEDLENIFAFVGGLVAEFGEEKFITMCDLFESFVALAGERAKGL